ncbi:hypothetical protein F0562_034558 [Nyssa sinensis]|uniref:Uncharacterized protein n=1 Tax=Nyssa sinensis TaxID=561372 RepID=A0A5J5AIH1_9ASTE|nr:hypothetical protein F0562_034558 [Nyssa sinensis]
MVARGIEAWERRSGDGFWLSWGCDVVVLSVAMVDDGQYHGNQRNRLRRQEFGSRVDGFCDGRHRDGSSGLGEICRGCWEIRVAAAAMGVQNGVVELLRVGQQLQ